MEAPRGVADRPTRERLQDGELDELQQERERLGAGDAEASHDLIAKIVDEPPAGLRLLREQLDDHRALLVGGTDPVEMAAGRAKLGDMEVDVAALNAR